MYVRLIAGAEPRDAALIDRMVGLSREQNRVEARLAGSIVEFVDLRRSEPVDGVASERARVLPGEFAADEIAAALGWTTHRVQSQAAKFRQLRSRLPMTCALWRDGTIDGYTAGKVVEAADRLTRPESVAALDHQASERAASHTPTQLSRWLNRAVAKLEPDAAGRRHRQAMADRKVCTRMEPDGMGSLWMLAGAADIAAIDHRLNELARHMGADDPRSMDQRRTDLARDLLLGHGPRGVNGAPGIGVVVPIQSLTGIDDTPGELADRSNTVPASLAREIAARPGALFYRLLTDEQGHLLDVTELGRFPSKLLGYAIDVRDGTCVWSTCTVSASKGDHDHTIEAPDGPTAACNLGPPCRRHHRAKTHAGFGLDQPEPGVFVWTTPTGHKYVVEPEPLPVGRWPTPTMLDDHTPMTELMDLIGDPGPPLWETTVTDALPPGTGHEILLRHELDAIAAGPAPP